MAETTRIVRFLDVGSSISFNIVASCGTIFVNKYLFQNLGFKFGTVLTVVHFLFTFLLLTTLGFFDVFEVKRLPFLKVLPICFAFCGYVVFNNISLVYNSVSFYQVAKILCTPTIIVIEFFIYGKKTSKQTLFSLVPVCLGIFITVVTDTEINLVGTVFALLAVAANSFYTVFGKTKQDELKASPMQILLYQSCISAFILAFFIPFFDDMKKLKMYQLSLDRALWILTSALFAAGVNFSFFFLVGKTSPLSVNVVGYLKTCIVFVGGVVMFAQNLDFKNAFGVFLTLIGIFWYSWVKVVEDTNRQKEKEKQKSIEIQNSALEDVEEKMEEKSFELNNVEITSGKQNEKEDLLLTNPKN